MGERRREEGQPERVRLQTARMGSERADLRASTPEGPPLAVEDEIRAEAAESRRLETQSASSSTSGDLAREAASALAAAEAQSEEVGREWATAHNELVRRAEAAEQALREIDEEADRLEANASITWSVAYRRLHALIHLRLPEPAPGGEDA